MPELKIDPRLHVARKPEWIKVRLPTNPVFSSTRDLLSDLKLTTVCEEAQCPNRWECWSQATATVMIGGESCTRACGFCAVDTSRPLPLDVGEPLRVAMGVERMGLRHVVVTGVARDDLADGGAGHFAATTRAILHRCPGVVVEVLVPDFQGATASIQAVLDAGPRVFNHNIETVERLTPMVRHRARYPLSLEVLRVAKELSPGTITKSGIMLGFGESPDEVAAAMDDLRAAGVQMLTIGQYLRPTPKHLPVVEYLSPDQFERYALLGREKGFAHVFSAPLVRSSYHAGENPLTTG